MSTEAMILERLLAMSEEGCQAWLASDEHRLKCAAYSEGQTCCLEKLIACKSEKIDLTFTSGS